VSGAEFWLQALFAPSWKVRHTSVLLAGFVLVLVGQSSRIAAMWTAASNFSHRIEHLKRKEHVLVTHGVYRYVRHPSYMGWFLWTVGSQVLLANPLCAVGYSIVSWGFFKDRIPYVHEPSTDPIPYSCFQSYSPERSYSCEQIRRGAAAWLLPRRIPNLPESDR
jgi:hypothetical protein